VLLEAMAAGLPVVAVRASGAVDTLTDGRHGLLTELDRLAFARAAVDLLRDEGRRAAMGRAARETVERYSLERVTDQFLALYEEAIARRRKARG
ncbi:MAG: glycosyltransferase, partial [Firmicutes bacterium]|nr:glycosyltransferase [Bacillota bacterium]